MLEKTYPTALGRLKANSQGKGIATLNGTLLSIMKMYLSTLTPKNLAKLYKNPPLKNGACGVAQMPYPIAMEWLNVQVPTPAVYS